MAITFGAGSRQKTLIVQFSEVNTLSDQLDPHVRSTWQRLGQAESGPTCQRI
jgi:hypothetical protein